MRYAPDDAVETRNNINLYACRVFKTATCDMFISWWLLVVEGVVGSNDIPLNISHEPVHQHKMLCVTKKNRVKNCLDMFAGIS